MPTSPESCINKPEGQVCITQSYRNDQGEVIIVVTSTVGEDKTETILEEVIFEHSGNPGELSAAPVIGGKAYQRVIYNLNAEEITALQETIGFPTDPPEIPMAPYLESAPSFAMGVFGIVGFGAWLFRRTR